MLGGLRAIAGQLLLSRIFAVTENWLFSTYFIVIQYISIASATNFLLKVAVYFALGVKLQKILCAVAALTLLTTTAQSADLLIAQPAPLVMTDAGFDWSGFYAGINAGYAGGQSTSTGSVSGTVDTINLSGGLLGATIGVNAQFDSFVLGAEGDVSWSGMKGDSACVGAPALTCAGSIEWLASVKARAGFAADRMLFFVAGGLAAGGAKATVTPAVAGTDGVFSGSSVGWTIGAGVEAAVTEQVSVKAEYAYYDLGKMTAPVGALGVANAYDLTATAHSIKVGVNFHF